MKRTSKILSIALCLCIISSLLAACSGSSYDMPYERNMPTAAYNMNSSLTQDGTIKPFAYSLCIDDNTLYVSSEGFETSHAYGLFDLNNKTVLTGENMYEELPPASLTKVLTALVALKYGDLSSMVTISDRCHITEPGAQLYGFKTGDTISLEQALNVLLLYSANDVAVAIAETIGGDYDTFIQMMNDEAKALGCTHSHFVNPHGLTAEDHYTCCYDLYLIFNQVIKYDAFREIIARTNYSSDYIDAAGNTQTITVNSTNRFVNGSTGMPDGITVVGGKTGTTAAAGNCLILYAKDEQGNPYISVILNSSTRDDLYNDMTALLELTSK